MYLRSATCAPPPFQLGDRSRMPPGPEIEPIHLSPLSLLTRTNLEEVAHATPMNVALDLLAILVNHGRDLVLQSKTALEAKARLGCPRVGD